MSLIIYGISDIMFLIKGEDRMKKHLYLMRHGQTLFNLLGKIQGWCDSPLTETGIYQAKCAAAALSNIRFDHAYSSTAERCCDTLEIVTNYQMSYTRLKGLRERYFGTFEGESEKLNPSLEYYDDIFPLYGGEYFKEVQERVSNTLNEIMKKEDHQCVLAVSHGGASYSFLCQYYDPKKFFKEGGFTNCCIMHFTYENGVFTYIETIRPDLENKS